MIKNTLVLLIIALCSVNNSQSQDDAHVFGKITYYPDKIIAISEATILIKKDGKSFKKVQSDQNGNYDFRLDLDFKYELYFSKKGYVTKWIIIDTKSIPEEDKEGGFDMKVDMSLFKKRKNLDAECFQKPIAIMHYYSEENALDWDLPHTENLQIKVIAAHLLADSLNKPQFDLLVEKGNSALQSGNKKKAEKLYKKAQLLIPDSERIKEKLNALKAPVRKNTGVRA